MALPLFSNKSTVKWHQIDIVFTLFSCQLNICIHILYTFFCLVLTFSHKLPLVNLVFWTRLDLRTSHPNWHCLCTYVVCICKASTSPPDVFCFVLPCFIPLPSVEEPTLPTPLVSKYHVLMLLSPGYCVPALSCVISCGEFTDYCAKFYAADSLQLLFKGIPPDNILALLLLLKKAHLL